jgi:antitoxin component of RelBE/YafQ-DinJ toxin-antitoxin module
MELNLNLNSETGKQAVDVITNMGFTLEDVLSDYLQYIARTKNIIPPNEEPSEFLLNSIKKSDADYAGGHYKRCKNLDDLFNSLG